MRFLYFAFIICSWNSFALNLDLPREQRSPIRANLTNCQSFLITAEQIDDSVGIPFVARTAEDFEKLLSEAILRYGKERFKSGTFYLLGRKMSEESQEHKAFVQVLHKLRLDDQGIKLVVLSVPDNFIEQESRSLARKVIQRVRYFFPSLKRDYQNPQMGETVSGLISSGLIEVPNMFFLYGSLSPLDAQLTITAHAITLGAYNLYAKAMLNWLLRPGKDGYPVEAELFLKQVLLSAPFVVNYNVFSHFGEILDFYARHGWTALLQAFPNEMAAFASTQGLTLVLQTIFFSQVITKGFGGWMSAQIGEERVAQARALRPWIQTPVLIANGIVLAMAASNWGEPLLSLGPAELNMGHVSLMALTAAGTLFFNKFPNLLNRILPLAGYFETMKRKIKDRVLRTKDLRL